MEDNVTIVNPIQNRCTLELNCDSCLNPIELIVAIPSQMADATVEGKCLIDRDAKEMSNCS